MALYRRIITGSVANSAGIATGAILQLLSLPVLVSAWGPERYGVWVMLTTIPTYFALTDLGFVQASTSEMAMRFARGEREKLVAVFQSTEVVPVFWTRC